MVDIYWCELVCVCVCVVAVGSTEKKSECLNVMCGKLPAPNHWSHIGMGFSLTNIYLELSFLFRYHHRMHVCTRHVQQC